MAKSSTARQDAKGSATGSAQTSGSTGSTGGRRPGPREDSDNTTETAAEAPAAPPMALLVIAPHNVAKRKGTKAYDFYQKYPPHLQMSDVVSARKDAKGNELVRGKDISWDADRRHILLGEEAENFPIDGTRDEQAEYLRSLPKTEAGFSIDDKRLIAWGFMDAPVEEKAEAKAEVQAEDANA